MTENITKTQKLKTRNPKSDIEQIVVISKYEFYRFIRGYRLPGLIIIALLAASLIVLIPLLTNSEIPSDSREYAKWYVNFVNLLVVLSITFYGADMLCGEIQNRTAYILFPNPVKREIIFFGKFLASIYAGTIVLGIYYTFTASAVAIRTGNIPGELERSFLLALFYFISGLGVAYLISGLLRGTTGANVLTFVLFFLIFPIITTIMQFTQVKPYFSITFAAQVISDVLTVPYPSDQCLPYRYRMNQNYAANTSTNQTGGITFCTYYPGIEASLLIMFLYLIISTFIALYLFKRKEVI